MAKSEAEASFLNSSLNMTAMAESGADLSDSALAVADEQGSEPESPRMVSKYQCSKCPCKYKRSNDLSKHLKLKHGEVIGFGDLFINNKH